MNDYPAIRRRIFDLSLSAVRQATSSLFFWLLLAQWVFAILATLALSPRAWEVQLSAPDSHLKVAVLFGGLLNTLPLVAIRWRPDAWYTRQAVAVAQMLWATMLIHLTGGRIETHFHIFGSLAFLAFYRDVKVLLTATAIVTLDHLLRGLFFPESIYGIANPEWWRLFEHAGWVLFEVVVLTFGCSRSLDEMRLAADREVALEMANDEVESRIQERTRELARAHGKLAEELRFRLQTETELRQAQKLESVGRLAAGVAHEINTPVQFVGDSVHFLKDAIGDFLVVVSKLQEVRQAVQAGEPALDAASAAVEAEEQADLPFLFEQFPKAVERALDGLGRVTTIVRSMKEFAHPDAQEMTSADLNRAIKSTLVIAKNEYKYVAELVTDFGELPFVMCHLGEFNQVILNIVVNAAHAIGDVVGNSDRKGRIEVRTFLDGNEAVVTIRDTGQGIPESVRAKVFDPFFTTKEVGKGTGQGLAIAHAVVVEKHGGKLSFESQPGQGTTFTIRLPIDGRGHPVAA